MTDIITQKISVEINQTAFNVDIASDKTVNIYNNTDAVWGDITGNLSDQDDLQTKLESIDSSITAAVALLNQAIAAKQDLLGFTAENTAKKGVANGYASLNSEGKVPQSQLDITFPVVSVNGSTGAVTLTKADLTLDNVDNTSDINKPVSTATQTALNLKATTSSLAIVATSGSYVDLFNKPTIPGAQVNSDWAATTGLAQILNKPTLSTVATTGSYNDLFSKPTIPTLVSQLINDSGFITSNLVTSVAGRIGAISLTKSDVGLSNVDNTSDLNKPVSNATQTALNLKQDSNSAVTLTGNQTLTNKTLTTPVINSPTGITKSDVGLSNVVNLDTSNPVSIAQSANYRFVSDTEKSIWSSKQSALGYVPEDVTNKSATTTLGTSNTLYPTQGAVKSYVDTIAVTKVNISSLATVATSGSYLDLSNKPTIPTNTNQLTNGSGYLVNSNNLSDLSSASTARTNLGLGTLATQSGTFSGLSSGANTGDETTATIQTKLGVASTSASGYLTSTDWNTFNGKQNVLTNPVTGMGASGQITYFNGVNSITSSSEFTFTPTSQLLVNNRVTAASAIARGTNLTPVLTAGANSDVLVGLDINPTFNNRSFSSVSNFATRITGNTRQIGKQEYYTIGDNLGRLSTEIYQDVDIQNTNSGALYIVPLTSGGRIYFGRAPNLALLNFAGVIGIENMPPISLNGAIQWQGSSFGLNRVSDDMIYYSGTSISGRGAHRFFTNSTNSGYTAPDEVFTIANTGSVSLRVCTEAAIPLVVQGAASQTANLQEWQNSTRIPLSSVKADGSYQPARLADSAATNNSMYYSTTQSKLVYKDSSGIVNLLY